jgi:hypothetical protein
MGPRPCAPRPCATRAAIAEAFKIERGLIGPVESVLHQVPYGMGSGWSPWPESLSSEPRN